MRKTLIRNGFLIDGTGNSQRLGDLLIEGDRISAVGTLTDAADEVIDAAGKVVCPGFIDIHRHCDAKFFQDPHVGDAMLAQGIC